MMRRFPSPSPSMVVALTALTVSLGGTGYAAVTLSKNSVGTTQIRANAVGPSEIKAGAVRSSEVKNGSLLAADFAAGQLPSGAQGPAGPKGDKGETGATGAFGAATVVRVTADADLADGAKASYTAFCPAGQQAIAGGGRGDDVASQETNVTSSRPVISTTNTEPPATGGTFTGWRITVTNITGGATTGIRPDVWVVCVPAPPAP